jgi:hypothetical protein
VIRKTLADNQSTKGKVQALEQLRDRTLALASQDDAFKRGVEAYQAHVAQQQAAAGSAAAGGER